MSRTRLLIAISLVALGCASPRHSGVDAAHPGADSGVDAHLALDTGPLLDGGLSVDASTTMDVGPMSDGGHDGGHDAGLDTGPNRCTGIDCSAITSGCIVGVCNPATGGCTAMRLTDGMPCNDGNLCTMGDACAAGACRGTATDCSALSGPCATGMCVATTGACAAMPLADGSSCGTPTAMCTAPVCSAGACITAPTNDCGSCGTGMACAGGVCGAAPASLTYDFESGGIPATWTSTGMATWTVTTTMAHGGTHAMRAGTITDSQSSGVVMHITTTSAATLSFWVATGTESCCDHLQFYTDGALYPTQWSGVTAWTRVSISVAPGAHTFEWRYTKDGSVSSAPDTVFVDDIQLSPLGNPNTDFEGSASLPSAYSTGGTQPWVTDTSMPHGGTRAAASGIITDSQSSSIFTSIVLAAASPLTFWYRVQSESCCDHLLVFDNGTQLGSYSGDVAWTMASFSLAAGTHSLEWRYQKDGSISTGLDRAFVDDISFGFTPVMGPLCGG